MFNPLYRLTAKLLADLTAAERLYGQLESKRIPKNLELNLRRDNLVKSSYISTSIEGNPLTLPEVTNLLLDERVPVNRNEKEVKNYFDLLNELPTAADQPSNLSAIKVLHRKLMTGINDGQAGNIRNSRVVIGSYAAAGGKRNLRIKHEPPFHRQDQIETALKELLDWTETDTNVPAILKAGIFHHQYVYIHPFEDGNGRTCRLLTARLLLKHHYQINKYFVLDDYYDIDRLQYSDKLNSADKGDKTEWLEYFTAGMKYSLQSALARVNKAMSTTSVQTRPTPKEQVVLEFFQAHKQVTSLEIARELKVSRQQAHRLLNGLVMKGFAEKSGDTKGSYYQLK